MSTKTHQQIWKTGFGGYGIQNTTLCGTHSEAKWEQNDGLNVGARVDCKNCLKLLSGERVNYNSKWLGKTSAEVEAMSK